MADRAFTIDIVTPERVVLSDRATSLVAPGVLGSFGVLANHAPLLTQLETGELRYRRETGEEIRMAVSGGFFQVFGNQVTVLADTAERAEEIDLDRARVSLERARAEIRQATGFVDDAKRQELENALRRAENRVRVRS